MFICSRCFIDSLDQNSNNNIVALILARGGSKGVPNKNIVQIHGLSLIGRALAVARNANIFSEIWVSTDSDRIGREAEFFGVKVHIRPDHLARDETPSIDTVLEFLEKHKNVENIALIQCTSVFVAEKYLEEAMRLFHEPNVDCVFSVVR